MERIVVRTTEEVLATHRDRMVHVSLWIKPTLLSKLNLKVRTFRHHEEQEAVVIALTTTKRRTLE